MLHDHFKMLARYNAWANRRIYDAVAQMSDEEIREQRPAAFFDSILGTLNHILVVDKLWFGRAQNVVPDITGLDQILFDDFAALRQAREAEDAAIIDYVDGLHENDLSREYDYMSLIKGAGRISIGMTLATVFNHHTHHRGQVHAFLKEAQVPPPPLDIVFYLGDTK